MSKANIYVKIKQKEIIEMPKKKVVAQKSVVKTDDEKQMFAWYNGTKVEKIAFIVSVVLLLCALVFLIFEFVYENEAWPYAWFNTFISLTFFAQAATEWRFRRSFGIISVVAGLAFAVMAVLKFCAIF